MTMQRQLWWAQPTLHDGGGGSRAPLYPFYTWIPACAGMTELMRSASGGVGTRGLIGNAWHSFRRDFWIPASAGMAGQVQQDAAGSLRVSLNSSFHSPKIEDPPQEEWGPEG